MTILSLEFALFCALVFLLFYRLTGRWRWRMLLAASYCFYGWGNPRFLIFLMLSGFSCYVCARLMDGHTENIKRRWLAACQILNLGILCFLKYSNFLIETLQTWGLAFQPFNHLILPLGISFYTFQNLSYVLDVYRGSIPAERDGLRFALFSAYFPQLAEGPIGRYAQLSPQLLVDSGFDRQIFVSGLRRILVGCCKKMLIADRLALFINAVYAAPENFSAGVLIIVVFTFAFQLYADFSGYMDIALGASQCLGIKLCENFEAPFFSRSVSEFWRRWHITMGAWFRDYVYYSVLRSRFCDQLRDRLENPAHRKLAGQLTTAVSLFCVWALIGLWHGAAWTFVVYGLLNGAVIILAVFLSAFYGRTRKRLRLRESKPAYQIFQMLRTFLLISLFLVFFRADTMAQAWLMIRRIFCLSSGSPLLTNPQFAGIDWLIAGVGIVCLLWTDYRLYRHKPQTQLAEPLRLAQDFLMIFALILFRMPVNTGFIYFQF